VKHVDATGPDNLDGGVDIVDVEIEQQRQGGSSSGGVVEASRIMWLPRCTADHAEVAA
jgi:hypothetical protein